MRFLQEIPDHIAEKLIEAIKTHDECIINDERITSAKYDEEIDWDGEAISFAIPFKLKNHKENIRLRLKFEWDCGDQIFEG